MKVQVGTIGILDMLRFKNLPLRREKVIRNAPAAEISAHFKINDNAAALHPDFQEMVISDIIDHEGAGAKSYILSRKDGQNAAWFRAGQYLSVSMQFGDSRITRPYSISCSPLSPASNIQSGFSLSIISGSEFKKMPKDFACVMWLYPSRDICTL